MAGYWLKLYTEILDDFKYYRLSDNAKLGMYELFILAKTSGDESGSLPPLEEIAFKTRRAEDWWKPILEELASVKIISYQDDGLFVSNFSKRQSFIPSDKRQREYRAKKHKDEYLCNEPVTNLSRNVTEIDIDRKIKKEEREEKKINSSASTSLIVTSETYKDAPWKEDWMLSVWREVTGYTSFTGDTQKIIDALDGLRYYRKPPFKDQKELIAYLKPYCAHWQTLKTKNGIPYSKRNPAWLERAIAGDPLPTDKRAPLAKPDPDCPKCGGLGMYRRELDVHDQNFGKLQKCDCVKVREEVEA